MIQFLRTNLASVLAAIAAVALLAAGWQTVRLANARAEAAQFKEQIAENTRRLEAKYRAKEQAIRTDLEKIANEHAEKETELASRAHRAESAADRLRRDIERLNAGTMPADPAAAAIVQQARSARKLLGACATEYRSVAEGAEQLRIQLSGLQGYVSKVCIANESR